MERVKVLLDTDPDILGDIDDALCLAYLLAQPACDLVGITTVSYDTHRRAMFASALCRAAGRDTPIMPGASTPLLAELPSFPASEEANEENEVLGRWTHEQNFPTGEAVEFMRRTIRTHPGEIILLAIGPMTNVALLFSVDPEIPSLLKGLVLMCGRFTNRFVEHGPLQPREWNARVDPHATAIVYRADVAVHRSVGLDVTQQVTLDADAFWDAIAHQDDTPLRDFIALWFRHRKLITFHDPLAAATIFDGRICAFEKGRVEVELSGERFAGFTAWNPNAEPGPHEVAVEVDRQRFLEHFFSVLRSVD